MDYRADRKTVTLLASCRDLRRRQTPAEKKLWELLRGRRLDGFKFRRQHQFGPYILDFYCAEARVAVEVDGAHHYEGLKKSADEARDEFLECQGMIVVRVSNRVVLEEPSVALRKIREAILPRERDGQGPLEEGGPQV